MLEILGDVALNSAVDPVGQAVGVLKIIVNSFARRIAKDERSLSSQSERTFIAIHRLKYKLISNSNSMADLSL